MGSTLLPALFGFLTGLSLIVAIGAQNAYVLRVGIGSRARVVAAVVVICAVSDAILILAGILGIGALLQSLPMAIIAIRVVGSGFLIVYGLMAARRAIRPSALRIDEGRADASRETRMRAAVLTVLALTWLNPHVYLDTIVFLGSVANQQGHDERWWFGAGSMLGSVVWFAGLGFGARLLRPVFARPSSWRVLDAVIAVVMIGLGIRLAIGG